MMAAAQPGPLRRFLSWLIDPEPRGDGHLVREVEAAADRLGDEAEGLRRAAKRQRDVFQTSSRKLRGLSCPPPKKRKST